MTTDEVQEHITAEFEAFDNWMDRYNLLIEMGRDLPPVSQSEKTGDYLIEGCQSKVWLIPEFRDGLIFFKADSDALITKGIISLLVRVLSGRTPSEIKNANLWFIDKINLRQNLSPTRSNGLLAMIKQMRLYAIAFEIKNPDNAG